MEDTARATRTIDLAKLVERHWRAILASIAIAGCLGAAYFFLASRLFESNVEILVMKKEAAATSVSGSRPVDSHSDVHEDVLATHIRLFGSAQVVLNAMQAHDLANLPGIQPHLSETVNAADYIIENLDVGRGGEGQAKDAQVLNAAFRHTDAEEARLVLGALVESYQAFLAATFEDVDTEALGLIEQASAQLGAELEQAEGEYAQFRSQAPLLFTGDDGLSVHEHELVELYKTRAQLKLEKSVTESRLASVRDAVHGPAADSFTDSERLALIDDQHVSRLMLLINVERGDPVSEAFQAEQPERSEAANAEYDRLLSLRTEAGMLEDKFGSQHPRLAEVRDSIAELESFLSSRGLSEDISIDKLEPQEVISAYEKLLENDLVHLTRRLTEVDQMMAHVAAEAKRLDEVAAQDRLLAGEIERKQELYNTVLARLPEVGMATDFGRYVTPLLEPVSVAKLVWPNLLIVGALSVVLGLFAGFGWALWSEMSDQTFQSADEVGDALGAAVLGVIPKLHAVSFAEEGPSTDEPTIDAKIVSLHRAKSADAEAIRSVRTAMFFASQGAEQTIVQFTSPTPSDGKSLISANVAVALASAGKSVLLVDADLRKPTQQQLFGLEMESGLADLLVDHAEFPDVVLDSGVENLDVLPAGTLPPNPAELLSMPRFEEFLQARREQYDYVIVDSPPVLVVSDPLNVATRVDGVILVTPIKRNMAGAATHAARMLSEVGANLFGAVVNDLESRFAALAGGYGSYGTSGYGHSYGYISDDSGYTSSAPTRPVKTLPAAAKVD